VQAALDGTRVALADHWIRHVRDVRARHAGALAQLPQHAQAQALCELNVIEQVANICSSTVLADAWQAGEEIHVHGCVYSLRDGLLRDLGTSINGEVGWHEVYDAAVEKVFERHREVTCSTR
jgi:carbonic anhydrase